MLLSPFRKRCGCSWTGHLESLRLWQLDLDLEAYGLAKLAIPVRDVKKFAAPIVGTKSSDETARELPPDDLSSRPTAPLPIRVGLHGS